MEACFVIRLPASQHHDIFSGRPHHVSGMAPTKIKNCALHEGEFGKKGSIVIWDYVHGIFLYTIHQKIIFICIS
ncbi:unnamed protein product [Linum tenue]|uniref:Bet v I/Major latex protein domain-containing protein n=1 Tax=Linum tenue TaxID=586396 RepID=A0AAV0KKD4_9ROSI|nr:unnamed protein product [Linum tenue]